MNFALTPVYPASSIYSSRSEVREVLQVYRPPISSSFGGMRNQPGPFVSKERGTDWHRVSPYLANGFLPGAAATSPGVYEPLSVDPEQANPPGSTPLCSALTGVLNKAVNTLSVCLASPKHCGTALVVSALAASGLIGAGLYWAWRRSEADAPPVACPADDRALLDSVPAHLWAQIKQAESVGGTPDERIDRIEALLLKSPEGRALLDLFVTCEPEGDEAGDASVGAHSKRAVGSEGFAVLSSEGLVEAFKNGTGRIGSIEAVLDQLKSGLASADLPVNTALKEADALRWIQNQVVIPVIDRVTSRIERVSAGEEQGNTDIIHQDEILRRGLIRAGLRVELSKLQRLHAQINEVIAALNRVWLDTIG